MTPKFAVTQSVLITADGYRRSFEVEHNLARDVIPTVIDLDTMTIIFDVGVKIVDFNTVCVTFYTQPPKGKQYRVVVVG